MKMNNKLPLRVKISIAILAVLLIGLVILAPVFSAFMIVLSSVLFAIMTIWNYLKMEMEDDEYYT